MRSNFYTRREPKRRKNWWLREARFPLAGFLGILGQPAGHGAAQVLAVIVVALQQPHILVPAEALHAAQVAAREVQRSRDGRVPQPVRPNLDAGAFAEFPHHQIQSHPAQALASMDSIQRGEQWSGLS